MNSTAKHQVAADADLGIALLIAETENSAYEPLGPVSTINEAREVASADIAARMRLLERGGSSSCLDVYRVWARNERGHYSTILQLDAATLAE